MRWVAMRTRTNTFAEAGSQAKESAAARTMRGSFMPVAPLTNVRPSQRHFSLDSRYTTLLRAVELWGAVQADGLGRSAGDEELPPVDGLVGCREEDLSQQMKGNPEDRLNTAFVGLDDDGPVFILPFTGGVGEPKGPIKPNEKLAA